MSAASRLMPLVFCGACLAVTACASVNPAAMAKLASLDPLTADPQQIAVAARLPDALKLRTGDLMMVVKTNGANGPEKINETFYLEVSDAEAGDAGVIIPTVNDGYAGRAPDLGALEVGRDTPHYGPRWLTWQPFYR